MRWRRLYRNFRGAFISLSVCVVYLMATNGCKMVLEVISMTKYCFEND